MRNSDMVRQERLLNINMTFYFVFLGKTLVMTPTVQVISLLKDFRFSFIRVGSESLRKSAIKLHCFYRLQCKFIDINYHA